MNKIFTSSILAVLLCSVSVLKVPACCSLFPAHFSKTKGLAAEVLKDGKIVHLLGYQNSVNESDATTFSKNRAIATGNAMLLPIPSRTGSMTKENIVDTTTGPNIFKNMEQAITPTPTAAGTISGSRGIMPKSAPIQVFDHDIYTIVLAQNAQDIPAALSRVPEAKRPALNPEIFKAYAKWYKGWTFALCCFKSTDKANAKPMLWWYEPRNPNVLFFPALDAHDGKPPVLKTKVDVDHTIILSSYKLQQLPGHKVIYRDRNISGELQKLLPSYVIGEKQHALLPQGDFVANTKDVRQGKLALRRELPPGATTTKPN